MPRAQIPRKNSAQLSRILRSVQQFKGRPKQHDEMMFTFRAWFDAKASYWPSYLKRNPHA